MILRSRKQTTVVKIRLETRSIQASLRGGGRRLLRAERAKTPARAMEKVLIHQYRLVS